MWYLHVGLLYRVYLPLSDRSTPASSWEFLTTLGYEVNIIRGRRPYRWTIWVSTGSIFAPLPAHPTALD